MNRICDNLEKVRQRIATAAQRSGRRYEDIDLVAVTKTVPVEAIQEAISCGIDIIGENRIQEAAAKHPLVKGPVRWHLVGHLQRNKVKTALEIFQLIHSVDSYRLAEEISRRSSSLGRSADILIQVNTSGEDSKYGLSPEEAIPFLESLTPLPGLRVLGFMTIGAFLPDPEKVRPCFRKLRELFEKAREMDLPNVTMRHLSMGMTSDFPVAIEEGANMVRIGTAIFRA
jgi:pyridoxal phosphate enzyme (YggS family)